MVKKRRLTRNRNPKCLSPIMCLCRQEDAGRGHQVGPDGRRHRRHGRADGPGDSCQTGPDWGRQQVREPVTNLPRYQYSDLHVAFVPHSFTFAGVSWTLTIESLWPIPSGTSTPSCRRNIRRWPTETAPNTWPRL